MDLTQIKRGRIFAGARRVAQSNKHYCVAFA
jgi:hypothetical protein